MRQLITKSAASSLMMAFFRNEELASFVRHPLSTPSVGALFTYLAATDAPAAPNGSGKTLSHTRPIGRPQQLNDPTKNIYQQPLVSQLFNPSHYFLFDTNHHLHKSLALAPLRMDESLMIVAASTGYEENRKRFTSDHKDGTPDL